MAYLPGRSGVVRNSNIYSLRSVSVVPPKSFLLHPNTNRTPPLSSRVHHPQIPGPPRPRPFLSASGFSPVIRPRTRFRPCGVSVPVSLSQFLGPAGLWGWPGRAQSPSGVGTTRTHPSSPLPTAALAHLAPWPRSPRHSMESQCDYSMYFPAVPLPPRAELAGDPGRYRALPRRNHLYLGETVRFLLVLRCRGGAGSGAGGGVGLGSHGAWAELATTLAALASVSAGGGAPGCGGSSDLDPEPPGGGDPGGGGLFRGCSPLLTHGPGPATSGGTTTVSIWGDMAQGGGAVR